MIDAKLDSDFFFQIHSQPDGLILGSKEQPNDSVAVAGKALAHFLMSLDMGQDVAAKVKHVRVDSEFDVTIGSGMREVGALLLGKIGSGRAQVSDSSVIDDTFLLSPGTSQYVSLSAVDIAEAMRKGKVVGWIHMQPSNTTPSYAEQNARHSATSADTDVSHMIAEYAGVPNHVALITNRDGTGISAYKFDDGLNEAQKFRKLKGITIQFSSDLSDFEKARLMKLHYI